MPPEGRLRAPRRKPKGMPRRPQKAASGPQGHPEAPRRPPDAPRGPPADPKAGAKETAKAGGVHLLGAGYLHTSPKRHPWALRSHKWDNWMNAKYARKARIHCTEQ